MVIFYKRVPYSQHCLFNARPDTNHNALLTLTIPITGNLNSTNPTYRASAWFMLYRRCVIAARPVRPMRGLYWPTLTAVLQHRESVTVTFASYQHNLIHNKSAY